MTENKPETCTTWSYRLQHLSLNLSRGKRHGRQVSQTLCNAEAFGQVEMDEWASRWATKPRGRISDMPPCTKCARKAARL